MPRRSNEFQRLIRRIYRQLVPAGASVTESAMLRERDSATEREIDVLITLPLADSQITIAVECRDRGRAADVEWVDALIGKYRDLAIDRIVAVSRAGFTSGAKEKAESNRIETRTLREALEADWPKTLEFVNVARVRIDIHPEVITIDSTPQLKGKLPVSVNSAGEELPIHDYFKRCHGIVYDEFGKVLATDPEKRFSHINDLNRNHELTFELQVTETTVTSYDGTQHVLNRMWWRCSIELSTVDLPTRRELFGEVGVISADDHLPDIGPISTMRIQVPGSAPMKPIFFRPSDKD
jgi:hypothetical protein